MKPPRTYLSPETLKEALEQRLRTASRNGNDFARRRQLLVFDRFLARVVALMGDAATLKGGLVLHRIDINRTLPASPRSVLMWVDPSARACRST
jgi:hypothetical protein